MLCHSGVCYLLVLLINNPAEIMNLLEQHFDCEIVNERKAGIERLFVLKITWKLSSV